MKFNYLTKLPIAKIVIIPILLLSLILSPSTSLASSDYIRLYSMYGYVDIHNSEKGLINEYLNDYYTPYVPQVTIPGSILPPEQRASAFFSRKSVLSVDIPIYIANDKPISSIEIIVYFYDKNFDPTIDVTTGNNLASVTWDNNFLPYHSYNLTHDFYPPLCHAIYFDLALITFSDNSQTIIKCDQLLYCN